MKHLVCLVVVAGACACGVSQAEESRATGVPDDVKPAESVDAPPPMYRKAEAFDIRSVCEFLSFEGHSVILPKRAILHLPERFSGAVGSSIRGELIDWQSFCSKYRGVVTHVEVSHEEATGRKPISEARMEVIRGSDRIVVAVLNRNPVSVRMAPSAFETAAR